MIIGQLELVIGLRIHDNRIELPGPTGQDGDVQDKRRKLEEPILYGALGAAEAVDRPP
jgi:hypothetical protein